MAGGVYNVDFGVFVMHGGVFGQNGDAALPLDVAGVHHALRHLLVFTKNAALLEHFIHQGGLAMVNVSDNSDIANVITNHKRIPSFFNWEAPFPAGPRGTGVFKGLAVD